MTIEHYIVKASDLTICVSEYLAEKAREFRAKRIIIIPNGFESGLFSFYAQKSSELKHSEMKTNKKKVILYVGQIGHSKGVEILIKSLRYLPEDVQLIMVGPVIDHLHIRRLVQSLGVKDRIKFVGSKPRSVIPKYILDADVCVDPSGVETPIKIFEYGAIGKPTVSFKGQVEKRFIKGREIAVADWNPESLADQILFLLNNKDEALTMGERLQRKVLKFYRWEKITEDYVKVLESIKK